MSSRTPNASAIRGLVQPDSVNRTARALSASPRSRDASQSRQGGSLIAIRCYRRFATHTAPAQIGAESKWSGDPLVSLPESA